MAEELGVEIRDKVIQRFLNKLTKQHPELYYAPTSQIAREIHKEIQSKLNTLDFDEQVQVKRLEVHDIEIILGFHH